MLVKAKRRNNQVKDMKKKDNLYSNNQSYIPPTGDNKFDDDRKIRVRRSSIRGWRYIRHAFNKEVNERYIWIGSGVFFIILLVLAYLFSEVL